MRGRARPRRSARWWARELRYKRKSTAHPQNGELLVTLSPDRHAWSGRQVAAGSQAGSVTSATCASRWAMTSSAASVAATPWAPAPSETVRPTMRSSATTGSAVRDAERRDGAALVAGHLARGVGRRHRDAVDAQERAEPGPRDLAVARHEDEEVVALPAAHDHRLHDRRRLDPARGGRLRERAHPSVPGDLVRDARRGQGPERGVVLVHATSVRRRTSTRGDDDRAGPRGTGPIGCGGGGGI